jgi:hypothetical protein
MKISEMSALELKARGDKLTEGLRPFEMNEYRYYPGVPFPAYINEADDFIMILDSEGFVMIERDINGTEIELDPADYFLKGEK